MYESKFNVFCITETWLLDSIYDGEILPYDYTLYRKDRLSIGGIVLVAVNCSIPSLLLPSPPDLQVASVKLGLNKELILCTVYVPPNSSESYLTSLFTYLSDLTCSPNQCLILLVILTFLIFGGPLLCCPIFSVEPTHVKGNILDLVLSVIVLMFMG